MQKVLIAGLGSFCMALIVILVIATLAMDKDGPVIEYTGEQFTYSEGMDTSKLLVDVTAKDNRDGDVTSSLIIENIVTLDEVDSAVIIYAAKDKANNITTRERIIDYHSGGKPQGESQEETEEVQTSAGVETALDPDVEAEDSSDEGNADEESAEADQASNDAREKALAEGKPYLVLTTHEVTLKKGDTFNYANYIKEAVDDKDNVYRQIRISRTFDMEKAGTYDVEVYVQDSEGNNSNKEMIKLTVEE